MTNLYNIVCEEGLLCEAFKDPRLYQAWKTLQRYKLKWNDLFRWGTHVAWDKIDEDDIDEVNNADLDKIFKAIRRGKRGSEERPFVLLGMHNEKILYIYDAVDYSFGMLKGSSYSDHGSVDWYYGQQGRNYMSERSQFDYLRECDYVLKVYVDNKNVKELMRRRQDAISGAWIMTKNDHESKHLIKGELGKKAGGRDSRDINSDSFYGKCRAMAAEAVNRWKKIIAENKFKRDQDTTEIDNLVKDIMTRLPQACINATSDPAKYSSSNTGYSLERLMKMVYDKYTYYQGRNYKDSHVTANDEFLVCYQKYCDAVMKLKTGNTGYYSGADTVLKERDQYADAIRKKYAKIDEALKKYDA